MLMRMLLLIYMYSILVSSLPTTRVAECLRSCAWAQKVLALNPRLRISCFVTDTVLNPREELALCTAPNTNSTFLKDRIMGDLHKFIL